MAHVVAEPCIKCRYTECVAVCPVDCFYEGANFLVIDPAACIDCGACVPACPSGAIYPEDRLPAKWAYYRYLNARYASMWPRITRPKGPLPDADAYAGVENKREFFDSRPGSPEPQGADGTKG